jgi:hypothetical protein
VAIQVLARVVSPNRIPRNCLQRTTLTQLYRLLAEVVVERARNGLTPCFWRSPRPAMCGRGTAGAHERRPAGPVALPVHERADRVRPRFLSTFASK